MIVTAPLLSLLTLASVPAADQPVREQRSVGLGLAPAMSVRHLSDGILLPVGFAIDKVVQGRWAVSAAFARLPATDEGSISHYSIGGRRYLRDGALAPYLVADLGLETEEIGDTRTSPFLTGGVGVEWATRGGFTLGFEAALGPHYVDVGARREWQVLGRTRVFLGYRF